MQDEITLAVTRAIDPAVDDAEQWRALRNTPSNLSAWESNQRGKWSHLRVGQEDDQRARELFNRVLGLDQMLAAASCARQRD